MKKERRCDLDVDKGDWYFAIRYCPISPLWRLRFWRLWFSYSVLYGKLSYINILFVTIHLRAIVGKAYDPCRKCGEMHDVNIINERFRLKKKTDK